MKKKTSGSHCATREKNRVAVHAAKNEFESLVQYAESGSAEGMYYLAESYITGVIIEDTVVVKPDLDKAIELFTNSLRKGHQEAFARLSECQALKATQKK